MSTTQFVSKRHDTAIALVAVLDPPDGVTWNLQTSGVTVELVARLPDAATPKINAACVVTDLWTVSYSPVPGDVDTIGLYDVEFEVTLGTGKKITFPNCARTDPAAMSWLINPDYDNS